MSPELPPVMNSHWLKYIPSFILKRVEGRQTLQKIIGNTAWLCADNILRIAVGFFIGAWVARYLGPERFGQFNYATAFVALFSSFATLGLDSIVIRDIVRDPSCKEETLGSAFLLKFAGGVATLLLALGSISFVRPSDSDTQWLVGIIAAGALFQAFDVVGIWFQSQIRSKFTVYAKNAAFLAVSMVKVVLIKIDAPLIAFAWAGLTEVALGAFGLVIAYRLAGSHITAWCASVARAGRLLKDSWPLVFSGIAIYIQAKVDQVMLGNMVGNAEVGQYSAAMKLIELFAFVPMVIQSSVAPAVTQAKIAGEKQYYERLLNLYRLMCLLFIITSVPIFLFAERIVLIVYGAEYRAAGILLALFAVRLFFANIGLAKSLFITNENLFRYALLTAVVGSVANVTLNYILIPKYASIGAIWAMMISFFITTFFIDIFYVDVRKNLKVMVKGILTPWKLKLR